jgi:signal transduction histidine kinase
MEVDAGSAANLSVFIAPDHLDSVLDNLVVNATRAMGEAVLRRIRIAAAPEGGACRLEVTDTGCGIPEALHARVFDRDYTTREGGGFGLYFSRQTLARYEGRIFVQRSALGEGTTFGIVLRLA